MAVCEPYLTLTELHRANLILATPTTKKNPSPNRIHKPLLNLSRPFTKNKTLHIEKQKSHQPSKNQCVIRVNNSYL